LRCIQ